MEKQTYATLLANPQEIDKEAITTLDAIIKEFPYFQSARALQLKALKNEESNRYNQALKITAAYTTDRSVLFDYITSDSFLQHQISERILENSESIKALEVVSENISEKVSVEIDNQLKAEIKKAETILNPDLFQKKEITTIKKTTEEESIIQLTQQPLEFTKNETHSFEEWLKLTKAQPIERAIDTTISEQSVTNNSLEKEQKFELIDRFIEEQPDPSASLREAMKGQKTEITNLAKPFTKPSDSLMTETLAKVYLQQKNYKKAIQAYKILILKNPEKSGFFADQIRAIQKLIKE